MTDRRGNGLLADSYVPLILLTPVLADTMLDALGRAGIAAYAVPLEEDVLEVDIPEADEAVGAAVPTDHLYVDAKERRAAEEVLRAELPELAERPGDGAPRADPPAEPGQEPTGPVGDEEVWADLVARFYEPDGGDGAAHSWPDAEDMPEHPRDPSHRASDAPGPAADRGEPSGSRRRRDAPSDPEGGDRDSAPGLDDGEHFIPPPPPPIPRGDLTGRAAWAGLLGGPALLLVSTILGVRVPGWLVLTILCAFVAGFVVLLVRMGDRPPPDSGPDDGAVV